MKRWHYFVLNKNGKSYSKENGVVALSNTLKPLSTSPDGWQDLSIGYDRDLKKLGIVRAFTVPLGFVRDGADIIRNLFYLKNIEEEVYLFITRLNLEQITGGFRYIYKPFYKGELDLTTTKDEENKATVSVIEGGLQKKVKAAEGTTFEYPLDTDPEVINVKCDGIYLTEKHNWIIIEDDGLANTGQFLLGCSFTTKEGNAAGFASFTVYSDGLWSDVNSDQYIFTTTQEITGLKLKGTLPVSKPAGFTLYLKSNKGKNIPLNTGMFDSGNVTINFEQTFNAVADEHFFLSGANAILGNTKIGEGSFSVEFQSRYKTTYIKALKHPTLFNRIGAKIAGVPDATASTLLDGKQSYAITCGDAIRGLTGAKIKTSLTNFTEDARVRYGAGIGIEKGKLLIEDYAHFLTTASPIPLGQVKDLTVTYASDPVCNALKVGYGKKDTDDVNGRYAFNNTHVFTPPITKIQKELDLVSPYFSDPYAIELLRINYDGKTTTDNSSDNDVFVLNIKENVHSLTASIITGYIEINLIVNTLKSHYIQLPEGTDMTPYVSGTKVTIIKNGVPSGTYTVSTTFGPMLLVKETLPEENLTATVSYSTYELNRPTMTITGVPSPETVFNIEGLTPRRVLNTQSKWLNSIFYGFEGQKVTFQTTDKNADLVADGIVEKSDYVIGSDRLFLPYYVEFETEVPVGLPKLLEETPNKAFSFVWNDTLFTGFLVKAGIAPNDLKPQSYKLLLAADTDLTKLL